MKNMQMEVEFLGGRNVLYLVTFYVTEEEDLPTREWFDSYKSVTPKTYYFWGIYEV